MGVRRLRRGLAALALAILGFWLAACGSSPSPESSAGGGSPPPKLRVALVLPGSISDKGFNQTAYEGLMAIKEKLGAEVAYSENTPPAKFEEVFRDFASKGFQVVIGQGFEFGPVAQKVAPEFPQVKFVIPAGTVSGPNVASLLPASQDAAYLVGIAAGLMTKTNRIAGIAGFAFPVIVQQMEAFKLGAQAVNPKARVTLSYLGTFDDIAKARQEALAQIGAGADVLYHIADQAGLGVIQAAKEKGVWAIGWGKDQSAVAPDNVLTSQIVDFTRMMLLEVQDIQAGKFKGEVRTFGLDTGVVGVAPFNPKVPGSVVAKVQEVERQIESGQLKVPLIQKPSSQ